MIKICVCGLSSSGKSALGAALAKEFNIKHIGSDKDNTSYKERVKNDSEMIKLLENIDPKYGQDLNDRIAEEAKRYDNCVVTTWLGPWIIKDATLRVWLDASLDERARRRAAIQKKPVGEVLKNIKSIDGLTMKHYKRDYGIDMMDHSIFDLELNDEKLSLQEEVATIAMLALAREKNNKSD